MQLTAVKDDNVTVAAVTAQVHYILAGSRHHTLLTFMFRLKARLFVVHHCTQKSLPISFFSDRLIGHSTRTGA